MLVKGDPAAADDDVVAGLGLGIVSSDAAVVGGALVPSPLADADWGGWIWHRYVPLLASAIGNDGTDIGVFDAIEVDSKAMRKIKVNETLVFIGAVDNVDMTSVVVTGGIRVLFGEF